MGTKIRQQKRGHGGPAYRAPSHRYLAEVVYPTFAGRAQVLGFSDDVGRHPLLADLLLETGARTYAIAAESQQRGDLLVFGADAPLSVGNVLPLEKVPDGTPVFNVELTPGDGGRLCRSAGSVAYVVSHDEETNTVTLLLASKQTKVLHGACRATIGVANGGGRLEKPFKKAGTKFHAMHARNKYWPVVRGTAMSAYDHPHGGRSLGKSSTVKRSTPPGRKVGHVAASRTGRRKGKAAKQDEDAKRNK